MPEQAAPAGKLHTGQVCPFLLRQTHGDEQFKVFALLIKHAQRAVASADQFHRCGHDQTQHDGQLHVAAEDGFVQVMQLVLGPGQRSELLGDPLQLGAQTQTQPGVRLRWGSSIFPVITAAWWFDFGSVALSPSAVGASLDQTDLKVSRQALAARRLGSVEGLVPLLNEALAASCPGSGTRVLATPAAVPFRHLPRPLGQRRPRPWDPRGRHDGSAHHPLTRAVHLGLLTRP